MLAAYAAVFLLAGGGTSNQTATATNYPLLSLVVRMEDLLLCQAVALAASYVLQFGNQMLLTSVYAPLLVGCIFGEFVVVVVVFT